MLKITKEFTAIFSYRKKTQNTLWHSQQQINSPMKDRSQTSLLHLPVASSNRMQQCRAESPRDKPH